MAKTGQEDTPSSSPIIIGSQDPTLVISSDEELEESMLQIPEITSSKVEAEMESQ